MCSLSITFLCLCLFEDCPHISLLSTTDKKNFSTCVKTCRRNGQNLTIVRDQSEIDCIGRFTSTLFSDGWFSHDAWTGMVSDGIAVFDPITNETLTMFGFGLLAFSLVGLSHANQLGPVFLYEQYYVRSTFSDFLRRASDTFCACKTG